MARRRLSRRAFLGIGAAMLGAAGFATGAAQFLGARGSASQLEFFTDRDAARRVGEAYLAAAAPSESDVHRLRRSLGVRDGRVDAARFRAAVVEDFERNQIVKVSGWYLARAEARLCALVALGA